MKYLKMYYVSRILGWVRNNLTTGPVKYVIQMNTLAKKDRILNVQYPNTARVKTCYLDPVLEVRYSDLHLHFEFSFPAGSELRTIPARCNR